MNGIRQLAVFLVQAAFLDRYVTSAFLERLDSRRAGTAGFYVQGERYALGAGMRMSGHRPTGRPGAHAAFESSAVSRAVCAQLQAPGSNGSSPFNGPGGQRQTTGNLELGAAAQADVRHAPIDPLLMLRINSPYRH